MLIHRVCLGQDLHESGVANPALPEGMRGRCVAIEDRYRGQVARIEKLVLIIAHDQNDIGTRRGEVGRQPIECRLDLARLPGEMFEACLTRVGATALCELIVAAVDAFYIVKFGIAPIADCALLPHRSFGGDEWTV